MHFLNFKLMKFIQFKKILIVEVTKKKKTMIILHLNSDFREIFS